MKKIVDKKQLVKNDFTIKNKRSKAPQTCTNTDGLF